ncbi:MAG TPA: hypothetical protein V6C78_12380 [Crinalium sp.]
MIPSELAEALREETLARQQAEARAEEAERQAEQLKERLRSLGLDPQTLSPEA